MIGRRAFIGGVASIMAGPTLLHAQKRLPVIGFFNGQTPESYRDFVAAFHDGLGEMGFAEGRNVALEYRWAYNQPARFAPLAAELVERGVEIIVAGGTDAAVHAAKAATTTIPIVATLGEDPISSGLVASLARPGRNITGMQLMTPDISVKLFEWLHELVPGARAVATLSNPNMALRAADAIGAVAEKRGLRYGAFTAFTEPELEALFDRLAAERYDALVLTAGLFPRPKVVALVNRHRIPTAYFGLLYRELGGLLSYGHSLADLYRKMGVQAGRVLKGEKPADMPVERPSKFVLSVNLKTAAALGLTVPPALLVRADEVIE